VKFAGWILSAALGAYACSLAVHHSTPIDEALPLMAVLVTVVAWATYPAVMVAVPMLIAAEIAIPDEGMRLLAFGVILAAVFAATLSGAPASPPADPAASRAAAIAVAAIVLLRWIPLSNVLVFRELFLLAIAVLIVLILGSTPFAVTVAVITALVTPAIPLRTLALPLLVLFVAFLARLFGMPRLRLAAPSAIVLAFAMLFFAWSGIVARAFPYFLKQARPNLERHAVGEALPANASLTLWVPDNATAVIVSGANVPKLRRGAPLGTVAGATISIGDASDWGYMRRDQFFGARNPLPRDPAGKIRDYGYAAWVDGAGRVPLPRGVKTIVVTADASLPKGASLQVESFELMPR
jgi:MFS family permease